MAWELARAKEIVTSPRSSKVPSGDGEERRPWEYLKSAMTIRGL